MCGRRHHHRHDHRPDVTSTTRITADDVRASDGEREEVIAALRTHAGDGRLGIEELDQRIEAAYAAKTRRELVALTDDLPRAPRPAGDARREFAEHLRLYLGVMALLVVIWALTGMGYFWPIWPIVGWGVGIVSHANSVRRPTARRRAHA
jgi:Domain of unknown function (DUF1707)/2TM domain